MPKAHFFLEGETKSVCGRAIDDTEVFDVNADESELCETCKTSLQKAWSE